jgi:ribosomal protein S6
MVRGSASKRPSGSLTATIMEEINNNSLSVYEIGYLILDSVPEEKVPEETEAIRGIITKAGGNIIAEDASHRQPLAYTMRTKTLAGVYSSYDNAYFGWIKFEAGSDKVEGIKKTVELHPTVLRMLLISTVRENTYLGKRAPGLTPVKVALTEEKKDVAPATVEEMDKSIDEMVKEV